MARSSSTIWHPWAVLAFVVGMTGSASAGFTIRDLGVIVGSGTSGAEAINAVGQAAGMASNSGGLNVAVKTSGMGGFAPVSLPSSALSSLANSINVSGEVAGTFTDRSGIQHGFYSSNGQAQVISPLMVGGQSGTFTQGSGINAFGQVAGTGDLADGSTRAFIVNGGGTPMAINPLGTGGSNQGSGINDNGTVVGTSETSVGGSQHAFIASSSGSPVDLLTRNPAGNFASNTFGVAIANNGDVAGNGDMGRFKHAFFASGQGGSLVDLGLLPGASSSLAFGLNDHSRVVGELDFGSGSFGQPNSRAFLWDASRGMFDLNTLIPLSDQLHWVLTKASGINDSDQISGEGLIDGSMHGFILTPIQGESIFSPPGAVPEPPAFILSAMGLAMVLTWTRLRRGRNGGRATA